MLISMTIKYPYLPENRVIKIVPESDLFMRFACEARKKSNDLLISTGAVAVKDGKVLGEQSNKAGYNWNWLARQHQKWLCPRRWFKAKTGTKYWLCHGCATYEKHAETRLVNDFEKAGRLAELKGADLYLCGHWWCCKPCWDSMIRAGIENVCVVEGAKEKFDSRTW